MKLRVIGAGRAGTSLARALEHAGWEIAGLLGRNDPTRDAARGVEMLIIATPDAAITDVAAAVDPVVQTTVIHLSGALGLEVLSPHPRRGSLHPLVSLPEPEIGAERLRAGAWFAVAGDDRVRTAVESLGGRHFEVRDEDRPIYHAAACIASNHLVALLGQVERLAEAVGVPLDAYLDLARDSLSNVASLGPARALTGPVARGDIETIARHLAAIDPSERAAYEALADCAKRLVDPKAPRRPGGRS
jgi:predicted short-subunit dehydrogenase-like oxidoreductase (DUF2520 family)